MMPADKSNAPMTPCEYVETIVLPTLAEFRAARDDRRRAYLACLVICHVADSIGLAEAAAAGGFDALTTTGRKNAVEAAMRAAQSLAQTRCGASFEVVLGIANGMKHPGKLPLLPGTERRVPQFAIGDPDAGFGKGRWGVPGLAVDVDGQLRFLDVCAQQVLAAFICAYPQHLGEVPLSSFMDPGLEVLGLDVEPAWLVGVGAWAVSKPEIDDLWLFGSRTNGTARPDSDVDIAIVLASVEPSAERSPVHDWPFGNYTALGDRWQAELASIVGRPVSLEGFARRGETESQKAAAAKKTAIQLWSRPSD